MQHAGSQNGEASDINVANADHVSVVGFNVRDAAIVAVCVVVGLILRLDFMRAAGFTIDADEAIVGLMGRDILLGRGVPVFYYGQDYMGSLEAIMASGSFALFGVTSFALQLVPLIWSLILIVLTYCLGRSVAGRRVGLIAAALIAVPPPALLVWSSKARGGFIEVVVLGVVALCTTLAWLRRHPEQLRYPCAIGGVLGLGWWVNNQIIYFLVPVVVFCAMHACSRSMRVATHGVAAGTAHELYRGVAAIVSVGLVSFFVGGAPYWWYNIARGFPSVGMFSLVTGGEFLDHIKGLLITALPAVVGAQRFWQHLPVFPFSRHVAVVLYVIPIAVLMLGRWRHIVGILAGRIDRSRPVEILFVFCVACCLVFAVSSFGWLVQAPRYLLPLYVGIYPLIAVCCDWVWRRSRMLGVLYLAALLGFQVASSYLGGRGINGEPVVFGGQRVARDHTALIERLDRLGISRIRTNYWIGYRLAFETEERITFTVLGEPTKVRILRYEESNPQKRAELPLVLVQSEVVVVRPALKRFGYSFKEDRVGEYTIVYNLTSDLGPSQSLDVQSIGFTARASSGSSVEQALDGDPQTRWGTGAPQTPGQTFEVELAKPVLLDGVRYSYGAWLNDRPAELKVEVQDAAGGKSVVLSQRESPGAMHLSMREPSFTLRFTPIEARKVILTQLGRHPVLDWSIAELTLLAPQRKGAGDARQ